MAKGGKKNNHSMKNSIQKCRNEEYKNMQERWGPDKLYISSLAPDHTFVYFLFSYQLQLNLMLTTNHIYTVIGTFNLMCTYLSSKLNIHIFKQDSIWLLTTLNLAFLCFVLWDKVQLSILGYSITKSQRLLLNELSLFNSL